MLYKSLNWISLTPIKAKIDPSGPVEYEIKRPVVKPFAPIYDPRKTDPQKKHRKIVTHSSPLPSVITRPKLFQPRATVLAVQGNEDVSCLYGKPIKIIKKPPKTLTQISQEWERTTQHYEWWKRRHAPPCSVKLDVEDLGIEKSTKSTDGEEMDEDTVVPKSAASDHHIQTPENAEIDQICVGKPKSSTSDIEELENIRPTPLHFDNLVDSKGRFPEESDSSEDSRAEKVSRKVSVESDLIKAPPMSHQRKFRRLRRATRKLINWIESLKPQEQLHYHWKINPDGTKTNTALHPYIPYPEEDQPYPMIDEEEVVDIVRNAYGAKPALTLKIAVHDIENLPNELEKFDNFYYLKKRVVEDHVFKKLKKRPVPDESTQPRPANKYSFGMVPAVTARKVGAVGTIWDNSTGRRCRYGAWYLRHSLWRKMDASEEIRRVGAHESEETFERVTGAKRLNAVDSQISGFTKHDTPVCELYAAQELHKRLKANRLPVPLWLNGCESQPTHGKVDKEERKTVAFGSEVWRAKRQAVAEKPAVLQEPKIVGVNPNLLLTEKPDLPPIDKEILEFIQSLETS